MSKQSEEDRAQEILKRVALYLDALAGHVFDIEDTVSKTISTKGIHDELTIKNLQVLDFLRQSMEDLALMAFLFGTPRTRPLDEECIQLISSKLKLKSTRCLLGNSPTDAVNTIHESVGEIDLF